MLAFGQNVRGGNYRTAVDQPPRDRLRAAFDELMLAFWQSTSAARTRPDAVVRSGNATAPVPAVSATPGYGSRRSSGGCRGVGRGSARLRPSPDAVKHKSDTTGDLHRPRDLGLAISGAPASVASSRSRRRRIRADTDTKRAARSPSSFDASPVGMFADGLATSGIRVVRIQLVYVSSP
jgi:hypothetical protein